MVKRKSAVAKDIFREIIRTKGRFISITLLVMLAVGFYCGLRQTKPDMLATADAYFDARHVFDIRVQSTLGMSKDDLSAIADLNGVEAVRGEIKIDAIVPANGRDYVVSLQTGETRNINEIELMEGRLPETNSECAVEDEFLVITGLALGDSFPISEVAEGMEDALLVRELTIVGKIRSAVYINKVTRGATKLGDGRLSSYMIIDPSAVDLDYYTEADILVSGAARERAYSDAYTEVVSPVTDDLENLATVRAPLRRIELVAEPEEKLRDARQKLEDGKSELEQGKADLADAEQKLRDAREELEDGKLELADGRKEYEDGLKEYEDGLKEYEDGCKEYEDGVKEYEDGLKEYEDGLKEYEYGRKKYEDGRKEYEDGLKEYEDGLREYEDGRKKYEDGLRAYEAGRRDYENGLSEYEEGRKTYEAGAAQAEKELEDARQKLSESEQLWNDGDAALRVQEAAYLEGLAQWEALPDEIQAMLPEQKAQLEAAAAQLAAVRLELDAARLEIDSGWEIYYREEESTKTSLNIAKQELDAAQQELIDAENKLKSSELELIDAEQKLTDSEQELKDAKQELDDAEQELIDAERELSDNEQKLVDAEQELETAKQELEDAEREIKSNEQKLIDAKLELDDAWQELKDGEQELIDGEKEISDGEQKVADGKVDIEDSELKIAEAEREIEDGEKEVADVPAGEWYVFDRSDDRGIAGFEDDSDRMGALADIFPIIFFAVAALVCLTSMTRMVEEQRVELGTYKALGYSKVAIAAKFFVYACLCAVIGLALGLAIGVTALPTFIVYAYSVLYDMPPLLMTADMGMLILSAACAFICTVGATTIAALNTLTETPSGLLRPRAPKPGKRILLEYIAPLWRRMSFFAKVSARNIFRYKKRFFMTIVGIGGCTALILTGLGLHDSISDIPNLQFDELFRYDLQAVLESDTTDAQLSSILAAASRDVNVEGYANIDSIGADFSKGKSLSYDGTVIVPEDPASLSNFIQLGHRLDDAPVVLPETGAVVTEKLAELLDLHLGDKLTIFHDGYYEVTVADIIENYVFHYIYLSPSYYESVFREPYKTTSLLIKCVNNDAETAGRVSEALLKESGVQYVSYFRTIADSFIESMGSVNYVIVVIVTAAALLAFIVLYNLSNINILERMRELATIKVLGFYDMEVTWYVFRESVILTLIGIALGLVGGKFLHGWLVTTVEMDFTMFGRSAGNLSYLWSALMTVAFAIVVNIIGHLQMKKINMIESLKSVE
jgi:putative ABC transport system permease protein